MLLRASGDGGWKEIRRQARGGLRAGRSRGECLLRPEASAGRSGLRLGRRRHATGMRIHGRCRSWWSADYRQRAGTRSTRRGAEL